MGTKQPKDDSKQSEPDNVEQLFDLLLSQDVGEVKNYTKPKKGLDEEVKEIFRQAYDHREKLINFYIWYTVIFSIVVIWLVFLQVQARLIEGNENLEIVPQWVLYLLVAGMFGQFIGLLTIVTKKVWTFEPFFKHHADSTKNPKSKK
jgi:hypothetical protein